MLHAQPARGRGREAGINHAPPQQGSSHPSPGRSPLRRRVQIPLIVSTAHGIHKLSCTTHGSRALCSTAQPVRPLFGVWGERGPRVVQRAHERGCAVYPKLEALPAATAAILDKLLYDFVVCGARVLYTSTRGGADHVLYTRCASACTTHR